LQLSFFSAEVFVIYRFITCILINCHAQSKFYLISPNTHTTCIFDSYKCGGVNRTDPATGSSADAVFLWSAPQSNSLSLSCQIWKGAYKKQSDSIATLHSPVCKTRRCAHSLLAFYTLASCTRNGAHRSKTASR
jgi:hypothetical protein